MFDMLTLDDLYQLHTRLGITLTPMITKVVAAVTILDTPNGPASWTDEGEALLAETNTRMAAVRELRELMAEAYAEIERRQEEARTDA
jgi:hypothetical protein